MSKEKIIFSVDRKSAHEGENVMVAWECDLPDAVTLTINNGYTTSQIQLADSGSRSVTMTKSKGKTTLRLTAAFGGRIERKEIDVRVQNLKVTRTYSAPNRGRSGARGGSHRNFSLRGWWERVAYRLRSYWQRVKYAWQTMPPKTKRIYKFMLILLAAMWLSSLSQGRGYKAGYERGFQDAVEMQAPTLPSLPNEQSTPQGKVMPAEPFPNVDKPELPTNEL
ncbi:MAG: hypothetical protein IKB03_01920 [Tidjanibacter sp.]|nr:hypothetical protein [Tidjanibacter sp.]